MWAAISGLAYSISCTARAIRVRIPVRSTLCAVTTVLLIPIATFAIVFDVADSVPSPLKSAARLVDVGPVEAGFLSIGLPGHQEVPSSGLGVLDGKVFARPHQDELTLPRPRAV
jgi:hypothetical protein